nr:B-box zinc finger protein 20-like isoform X1 [Coffea arabica]
MKIQCDVCNTDEASVFCSADEAALCQACDHRVHHANKLASKHHRFSLLHHPLKDSPFCDICQERRALLFCQQDRALLCRECDIPVHKANQHTQKHDRFLLTGVRLSASSSANQTPSSSTVSYAAGSTRTAKTESKSASSVNDPHNLRANSTAKTSKSTSNHLSFEIESHWTNQEGSVATSSISEYLTETLPGWHVEDFLDPPSSFPYGLQHSCFFFFLFLFYNILSWWWNGVMLIQETWQYSH